MCRHRRSGVLSASGRKWRHCKQKFTVVAECRRCRPQKEASALAMASAGDEKRGTIENFDGSDAGSYRLRKRPAQLLIASLPTTVSKEKYGPRLMQYVKGEAEQLCEGISVKEQCSEGGEGKIFKLLDEKYGPRPVDLLHKALKTYFYEL